MKAKSRRISERSILGGRHGTILVYSILLRPHPDTSLRKNIRLHKTQQGLLSWLGTSLSLSNVHGFLGWNAFIFLKWLHGTIYI